MPPIFASLGAGSIRSYGLTAFKRVQALVASFFNLTSLLLNTSSTNGAQNNTFLDSSGYNISITRNGGATQGTFTPFSQPPGYWSNYFDGTDDFYTSSTALFNYTIGNASTQTATIEALIYITGFQSAPTNIWENPCIAGKGDVYMNFGVNMSGNLFLYHISGGTPRDTVSSSTIPLNTWTHVAVVISSGTVTLYINGVSSGSGTWYGIDAGGQNSTSYFGETPDTDSRAWLGYISNLRVSTTARAITVPTSPYINDGSTAFLTFQSNRIIDNSSNGYSLTPSGTPSVQAFSPFLPTDEYSIAAVGGSYYGDGSGDYLLNTTNGLNVNSGINFTFECWLYRQSTFTGDQGTCFFAIGSEATDRIQFAMFGSAIRIEVYAGTLDFNGGFVPLNAWTHVAIVRSGTTITIYINGVSATSATWNNSVGNSGGFIVGANRSVSNYVNGYISGLRFLIGTALYTTNFSPPTTPPTAISNTYLLLNFVNAGIYDATGKNDIETVGNAQVSTTQAKFGTTSMYFDGTGDWLLIPNNQIFNLNADFTIEFWIYLNSTSGEQCIFHNHNSDNNGVFVSVNGGGAGKIRLGGGNGSSFYVLIDSSTSISTSTWTHIACTRSGSTWTVYINGSSAGTATSASNPTFSTSDLIQVGRFTSGAPNALNGYIDEFRITKGYAVYTSNFSPPTAAFPLK